MKRLRHVVTGEYVQLRRVQNCSSVARDGIKHFQTARNDVHFTRLKEFATLFSAPMKWAKQLREFGELEAEE